MPASLPPGYTFPRCPSPVVAGGSSLPGNLVYATDDAARYHKARLKPNSFRRTRWGAERCHDTHLPLTGHYRERVLSNCSASALTPIGSIALMSLPTAPASKRIFCWNWPSPCQSIPPPPAPTGNCIPSASCPPAIPSPLAREDIASAYVPANGDCPNCGWAAYSTTPGSPAQRLRRSVRERFVYHVASCWDEPGIFIYGIRDHSYIGIEPGPTGARTQRTRFP